jgi:hypothetical protein
MMWLIVVLAIVVVVAAAVIYPQMRSRSLRQRFGPEYDHAVDEAGDRKRAEGELRERVKRHDTLEIRELDPADRDRYAAEWLEVQQRFIDAPEQAVADADTLVQTVMRERGYPVDEFDERIDMVSVDHPELADNYRVAHDIQLRSEQHEASTDDLREAIKRYRSLFTELLAETSDDDLPERGAR